MLLTVTIILYLAPQFNNKINSLIMSFLKRSLLLLTIVFFAGSTFAQSVDEAGAKYNEGNEHYKAKEYAAAVTSYKEAMDIATAAGADADGIKASIEKQLQNAYYKNGLALYKGKKFDAAIASLDKSYAMAEAAADVKMQKRIKIYLSSVRVSKGNALLKDKNTDDAFAEYKMATELNPKSAKGYYGMGLVYKTNDDIQNMSVYMDKAIEAAGDNAKKAKTVKKAKVTAGKTLVNAGAKAIQKEAADKAIEYITASEKYMPLSGKANYYLALAYNKKKDWDNAISYAKLATGMECDNMGDVFFALGQAYEGKAMTAEACDAYKNVTSGPNVEAAKYQMTQVLKCN